MLTHFPKRIVGRLEVKMQVTELKMTLLNSKAENHNALTSLYYNHHQAIEEVEMKVAHEQKTMAY